VLMDITGNNLERIHGYLKIDHESEPTQSGEPPAYWPASGALQVKNLSAKYSVDGDDVLEGLSFEIQSGMHIGVGEYPTSKSAASKRTGAVLIIFL
jgi:ABC-type bacteriocin/lantibiotic exporter with double-glycine peptidase domain